MTKKKRILESLKTTLYASIFSMEHKILPGRLKERLNIEKFTVKHTESVLQDIYVTLLIANLDSNF
jgi:predicted AAA+ superfamily ATPase